MMAAAENEKTSGPSELSIQETYRVVDPLAHPGWDSMLASFPGVSVFHATGWANVLRQSYGHTPTYLCRFAGNRATEILPIMELATPLRGRRGVSLPFTDFCPPLKADGSDGRGLYQKAMETGRERGWKFLECRSSCEGWEGATPSLSFYGHTIDLAAGIDAVFKRLDGSVRRGVKRAEGAGLKAEFSSEPDAVKTYYDLHCLTRKRHGLPPQPYSFFENIQKYILQPGHGFVGVVRLNGQAIAGAIFFHYGRQALYKFGASDYAFQQTRANDLLLWSCMRLCAERGAATLHLGRTSLSNSGLRRYKTNLGASEETVRYCRYDFNAKQFMVDVDRAEGWFNQVFARLPLPLLRLAGRILYPQLS